MPNQVDTDELIRVARSWVGVPWHHQGRSRAGVDCAGLPECVLRDCGVLPADYRVPANYSRLPIRDELLSVFVRWCERVDIAEPGTVLSIRWPRMPGPSHVAICTGSTLIHAYRASSGVVEHSYRGRWLQWTTGIWRLPGVRYE